MTELHLAGPFTNNSAAISMQYFTNASGYRHLNVSCCNCISTVNSTFTFYAIIMPSSLQLVFSSAEVVAGSSASNSLAIYANPTSAVSLPASTAAAANVNAAQLGTFFSCTLSANGSLSLPLTLSTVNWTNGSDGVLTELFYTSAAPLGLSLLSVGPCNLSVQCSGLYGSLSASASVPVLSNLSSSILYTYNMALSAYALRNATLQQNFSVADGSYLALNATAYADIVSTDILMSIAGVLLPINLTSSNAIASYSQPSYQFYSAFSYTFNNVVFTQPGVYNVSFVFSIPNHPEQTLVHSSLLVVEDACSNGNYQFLTFLNTSIAGLITNSVATTIGTVH